MPCYHPNYCFEKAITLFGSGAKVRNRCIVNGCVRNPLLHFWGIPLGNETECHYTLSVCTNHRLSARGKRHRNSFKAFLLYPIFYQKKRSLSSGQFHKRFRCIKRSNWAVYTTCKSFRRRSHGFLRERVPRHGSGIALRDKW